MRILWLFRSRTNSHKPSVSFRVFIYRALSSATFHSRLKLELFKIAYPDSAPVPPHVQNHHRLQSYSTLSPPLYLPECWPATEHFLYCRYLREVIDVLRFIYARCIWSMLYSRPICTTCTIYLTFSFLLLTMASNWCTSLYICQSYRVHLIQCYTAWANLSWFTSTIFTIYVHIQIDK